MPNSRIHAGEPLTDAETNRVVAQFQRDGYFDFGPALETDEVEALRSDLQRKWDDPGMREPGIDQIRGTSLMRMFEYSTAFRDLIVREPFASLAEAILGEDCHCMSQNALVTPPNSEAVADGPGGWHVDDLVHFPLPPDIPRHDPAVPLPCFVMQVFMPLSDVEELKYGPTQVVPGSHYAGRKPQVQDHPAFDTKGPHSFLTRQTHAYLFNNQMWHRGAPNASDRTRLMAGVTYSKRFIAQKFYPFIDYRMPEHVWEGASGDGQGMIVQADVSREREVGRMIDDVRERLGPVELLVNNAGVGASASHDEFGFTEWKRMFEVNVDGPFLTTWAVKDDMIRAGYGRIVNISSLASVMLKENMIHYATTKAAVTAFTRQCSAGLARHSIRVNCVAPGLTNTDLASEANPDMIEGLIAATPLGRMAEPGEIASVIRFLLSDDAGFVTGQTIVACGGRS